jgi:hypothetical protein
MKMLKKSLREDGMEWIRSLWQQVSQKTIRAKKKKARGKTKLRSVSSTLEINSTRKKSKRKESRNPKPTNLVTESNHLSKEESIRGA